MKTYQVTVKGFLPKVIEAESAIEAVCKISGMKKKDLKIESLKNETLADVVVELKSGLRKTKSFYKLTYVCDTVNDSAKLRMRDIVKLRNIVTTLKPYSVYQYSEEEHLIKAKQSGNPNNYILFYFNKINTQAKVILVDGDFSCEDIFDYDDVKGLRNWYGRYKEQKAKQTDYSAK